MKDLPFRAGAILGFLGVALGAFGAHALKPTLELHDSTAIFETAARYQMYHALLLIGMGIIGKFGQTKWLRIAAISTVTGIAIFSGSLYALSLTRIGILGAITPIGGLLLLISWASLFLHFYQRKEN